MTAAPPAPALGVQGAVWSFFAGNIVIGTGVVLPISILDLLAADLGISAAAAGSILLTGGLVVGLGAPLLAAFTSRIDRRTLLTGALLVYCLGHFLTALAPSLWLIIALRAFTMVGAALFTPQAVSTIGSIVPAADRARTIAFVFIGWSLASVLGLPLGRLVALAVGWHSAYLAMAGFALAAALFVWRSVPPGIYTPPLSFASWRQVATTPVLLVVLGVTLCMTSGNFTLYSYSAPVMGTGFGIAAENMALVYLMLGVSGVTGNFLASRVVRSLGIERTLHSALVIMALGLTLVLLGWGFAAAFVTGMVIQGIGGFASNSLQQARMVALSPPLAPATVALNTSMVYLGQAIGSTAGGLVMVSGVSPALPLIAVCFVLAALALSLVATRVQRTA